MIFAQNVRTEVLKQWGTVATDATDTSFVDTVAAGLHGDYLKVLVFQAPGPASNQSAAFSTIKLREGDTTSSFADISGFVGGTDFTAVNLQSSTVGAVYEFNLDLRKRKRYIQLTTTPGKTATTFLAYGAIAQFSRLSETPSSTAEAIGNVSTNYIRVIG